MTPFSHNYPFRQGHYYVYLPANYDPNRRYPVVIISFVYHGVREIDSERLMQSWVREAERRGYIVLLPMVGGGNLYKVDKWYADLLKEFKMKYPADRSQILLTGFGAGAHYSIFLGTAYPEEFGAVSPVAGSFEGYWKKKMRFGGDERPEFYFLSGEQDKITPIGKVQDAVEVMKEKGYSVQLETLQGVGHSYSDETTTKIADWFDGLRRNTPSGF